MAATAVRIRGSTRVSMRASEAGTASAWRGACPADAWPRAVRGAINWLRLSDQNMNRNEPVIHSDPEIMGGTPVFIGTRVPLETLLDYLESGQPLSEFLEDFPTVSREQAVAALEQAKEALLARARPA